MASKRIDPIRERYYRHLQRQVAVSGWLFYLTAAFSLAALLVNSSAFPALHNTIDIAFLSSALALSVIDVVAALYLAPRAEDARRDEFLSTGFNVPLTHERTSGYYNNQEQSPMRRLAAQTLENSFFSKHIALAMLPRTRGIVAAYFLVWIVLVASRDTSIGLVVLSAQILFSEHIVFGWIRLEWFRIQCERNYDHIHGLFQQSTAGDRFDANALKHLIQYETSKAKSGVVLSDAVFEKLNPALSVEWEQVKKTLGL